MSGTLNGMKGLTHLKNVILRFTQNDMQGVAAGSKVEAACSCCSGV
jgi:hypothetical protein